MYIDDIEGTKAKGFYRNAPPKDLIGNWDIDGSSPNF